jgi:hypothetical protein
VKNPREGVGRTVLVTGASAGIGRALAHVFAQHGFDAVLTARRAERLNELKDELEAAHNIRAYALPADLTSPDAPNALATALEAQGIAIDALVNNAGYNLRGATPDHAWEAKKAFLQIMAVAPYALTHLFLPGMRQRKFGRILNVSSVVGLLPGGVSNTHYAGVKALQVSFSEALHIDEAPFGIHVTALCPGLTYSEFHDADGSRAEMKKHAKFLWHTSESVAEAGYAALARNDMICVPGILYRTAIAAARILPRRLANRIAARLARGAH